MQFSCHPGAHSGSTYPHTTEPDSPPANRYTRSAFRHTRPAYAYTCPTLPCCLNRHGGGHA